MCVSYCEIAVRRVDVRLFVAKLGLDKQAIEMEHKMARRQTTQLLEALRHMPKLKLS